MQNFCDSFKYPPVVYAEIDLDALAHNIREIRNRISGDAGMMIAVKADAYGHGAVEISRVAIKNGAEFLVVARLEEACHLRQAGIEVPVLLLGHCSPEYADCMAENEIRASVNSLEEGRNLSREAERLKKRVKVHIKIDTGMGRLGIIAGGLSAPGEEKSPLEQVMEISAMPGLEVEGVFTHLAASDSSDKGAAEKQLKLFSQLLNDLEKNGIKVKYRHAANSAAAIEMPEAHFDMVRPGISVYGLWPSSEVVRDGIEMRPVMSVKARIIRLKKVDAGFAVSYGSTYVTSKPTVIATVPIGYADGYSRQLSNRGTMLVRGQRAPVVGRVCMDLTMIDVGHIPGVSVDDEVMIMGRQGGEEVSADEIAGLLGTINYEVVSTLSPRVQRIYV